MSLYRSCLVFLCLFSSFDLLAQAARKSLEFQVAKESLAISSYQITVKGARTLSMTVDSPEGEMVRDLLNRHLGQKVSILVDGKLIQSPVVREPIKEATFELTSKTDEDFALLKEKLKP